MGAPRDYREPARCRTKPRRRDCRQGGSRRLHAACHAAGSTCHQSALLSETRLRSEAFVPVTIMGTLSSTLVVNPKVPASTLRELIAFAKANPNKLSYASPGTGSPPHLAAAMLATAAGVRLVHVPYQGLAPAMTDLLAGHVDMMFDNLGNTLPHIRDGRLRVLATSSERRIPEFPDVPAVAEMYSGVVYTSWFAVVAPPKIPSEIVTRVSAAIAEVLRMPDVVTRLQTMSTTPGGQSPAESARLFAEERERWRKVIALAGIKAQ